LGAYFLELNGYDFCIDRFIVEMENIVVWLAEGKIDDDLLLDIITSIIYENEFNESIKLRLFEAVAF
jgi:death-on-curing protein